jgi:hypothetical protein
MRKLSLFFLFISQLAFGQVDSAKVFRYAVMAEAAHYSGSLLALNNMWYANYPRSSFHWYNDNNDWLQMDKVGHATSAYQVGLFGMDVMRWSGVPEKKAIWFGGAYGAVFLTTIELLDGFSAEWGASKGDLIANTTGSALLIAQELHWKEQRLQLKYNFYPTDYADQNPSLLGRNLLEQSLKDYNGQTYWLSANIHSFLPESPLPDWLNIALGYGADGMLEGKDVSIEYHHGFAEGGCYLYLPRERQFYLSLDVDLRRIKTKHKAVDKLLKLLSFIKLPAPAVQFTKSKGLEFIPLHYGQ